MCPGTNNVRKGDLGRDARTGKVVNTDQFKVQNARPRKRQYIRRGQVNLEIPITFGPRRSLPPLLIYSPVIFPQWVSLLLILASRPASCPPLLFPRLQFILPPRSDNFALHFKAFDADRPTLISICQTTLL